MIFDKSLRKVFEKCQLKNRKSNKNGKLCASGKRFQSNAKVLEM